MLPQALVHVVEFIACCLNGQQHRKWRSAGDVMYQPSCVGVKTSWDLGASFLAAGVFIVRRFWKWNGARVVRRRLSKSQRVVVVLS